MNSGPHDVPPKEPRATEQPLTRLSDEQVRAQITRALHEGDAGRAVAILGSVANTTLKQDECERVYSFAIKNRYLPTAKAVVGECWDGQKQDAALSEIEREALKIP